MRLGDLDALYDKVSNHVTSVSVCATAQQAIGQMDFKWRCLKDIHKAPTIDAIPVEWLKAHKTISFEDWGEEPVTVGAALMMWQKEQEGV